MVISSSFSSFIKTLQESRGILDLVWCKVLEINKNIYMDWESSPPEISIFEQESFCGLSMMVYESLGYDYRKLPPSSKNLVLRIYTLDSGWALGEIDSLVIPGANGEFCILKNHVNFLCRTDPGIIRIS